MERLVISWLLRGARGTAAKDVGLHGERVIERQWRLGRGQVTSLWIVSLLFFAKNSGCEWVSDPCYSKHSRS